MRSKVYQRYLNEKLQLRNQKKSSRQLVHGTLSAETININKRSEYKSITKMRLGSEWFYQVLRQSLS